MELTTMFAAVQGSTVYGVGVDAASARRDAAEWAEDAETLDVVPCTVAAAVYVVAHGGAASQELSIDRTGVCLRSEEA